MRIQLAISGKVVKEDTIYKEQFGKYYAYYKKEAELTAEPWEIFIVQWVNLRLTKMPKDVQKKYDKWLRNNKNGKDIAESNGRIKRVVRKIPVLGQNKNY